MNKKGATTIEIMVIIAVIATALAIFGLVITCTNTNMDKNTFIINARQASIDAKKFIEQENTDILPVYPGNCLVVTYKAISKYDLLDDLIDLDNSYVLLYQKTKDANALSAIVVQQNEKYQIKHTDQNALDRVSIESDKFETYSYKVGDIIEAEVLNKYGEKYMYKCKIQWIY